jgi:hypothetical protein
MWSIARSQSRWKTFGQIFHTCDGSREYENSSNVTSNHPSSLHSWW